MNTTRYTEVHADTILQKIEHTIVRLHECDATHIWITLRSDDDLRRDARNILERATAGEDLPLMGVTLAVKDNIDVAGLPTTCAAPWTSHVPEADATCVARLRRAGAIVVGKTNMDQFATGLVGTRSPYGVVSSADDPALVSGGSSAGSGVSVARHLVDIALGTDTAGSGRVPAAFNEIIGIKPTVGFIPTRGVTPACPSYDAVSIFCSDLNLGYRALNVAAGKDPSDPLSRDFPDDAPMGTSESPTLLAPLPANLTVVSPEWATDFEEEIKHLENRGYTVKRIDISPLLDAAQLLYGGALVAERYASVGSVYAPSLDLAAGEDPTVRSIILAAKDLSAGHLVEDQQHLLRYRVVAHDIMSQADALLIPTTVRHPSIAEVQADPVGVNSQLGAFTNFVNLLDLAALAIPSHTHPEFGITLVAPAFHDFALADLGARMLGNPAPLPEAGRGIDLFVVGEHMRGFSLNHQLTEVGAAFVTTARTAPEYALVALDTTPSKPTLVRIGARGCAIEGEVWRLPVSGLSRFLQSLPRPMSLGKTTLANGEEITGFGIDRSIVDDSTDISEFGGWRTYTASLPRRSAHTSPQQGSRDAQDLS